jgi:hypothetical protein
MPVRCLTRGSLPLAPTQTPYRWADAFTPILPVTPPVYRFA